MNNFEEIIPQDKEGFDALFEHVAPGIIITGETGLISFANTGIEKLLGYNKQELTGLSREVLFPADIQPAEKFNGRENILIARHKNGNSFPVEASRSYVRVKNSHLFIMYVTRVCESDAAEKLHSCYRDIEQFTHATSHGLREPLLVISGFTELLRKHYNGVHDETTLRYIEFITGASGKMQLLIKAMQDYLLLGSERKLRKVNCNKLVKEVLEDFAAIILEAKIQVCVKHLPTFIGEPSEIKLLFWHLISNAIKFRADADIAPEITITVSKQATHWQFSITDNGIGIEKKYHDRIFVLFRRLHSGNEYEGYGTGLAYCKKIVGLHEGEMGLNSTPGKGTTFYFTIKGSNEDKW